MTGPAGARIVPGATGLPTELDVLVAGLGVTGAGVALDAAARGLEVLAVDAFDVAWGTSRWSSKLVHGGLRYLAKGQVGVAHESAVERGILMERTAPHLTRALPMLLPLGPVTDRRAEWMARAGLWAGDVLRLGAGTSRETLPRPRRLGATEARALAPVLGTTDLRGGLLSWDGQLEDDARLVIELARTAVAHGADVRTRVRVLRATGTGAVLRDELTGAEHEVRARAVVSAAGVWSGSLDPAIRLRPSRGTHVVVPADRLPGLRCAVMAPVPGHANRFVFALPQPEGRLYIGLTDEEVAGALPDVPEVPEADIAFLLATVNRVLATPLTPDDVVGAYAGLRPLLDAGGTTADLSRRHAVVVSETGVVTVVGGKLTTYRRMAEDAVNRATAGWGVAPSPTRDLPLLGAGPVERGLPLRLVRRYGAQASAVLDSARTVSGLSEETLLAPAAPSVPVTLAELLFGITHEGAVDGGDLLDRRTRIGLVPVDRAAAEPLARRALEIASAPAR
ncbi:MAG: glycerol-3-phosphate dehydrogenase/oxidase [Marmoricola sp.]